MEVHFKQFLKQLIVSEPVDSHEAVRWNGRLGERQVQALSTALRTSSVAHLGLTGIVTKHALINNCTVDTPNIMLINVAPE